MKMNASEAQTAAARVMARCDALAEISESSEGLTRVYLSPEHLRANARVEVDESCRYAGLAGCSRQYLWAL